MKTTTTSDSQPCPTATNRTRASIPTSKRTSTAQENNILKNGMFRRAVPQMPRALACVCFVLNLIFPGTGKHELDLFSCLTSVSNQLRYRLLTRPVKFQSKRNMFEAEIVASLI